MEIIMPDSICSVCKEVATDTLTTIDAGVVTTIDSRNFRTGLIAIRNLGANTISYKIDGYANTTGLTAGIADKATTDILSNATATYSFTSETRAKRLITVVPKVAGSQSTYVIEYCLGL
jgi:hypothetical protein